MSLTQNGIQTLQKGTSFTKLVLQVVDIESLKSGAQMVILSDGVYKTKCSLGSGLEKQINDGLIKKFSVVKVTDATLQGDVPLILKMGLMSSPDTLIGNPSAAERPKDGIKTAQGSSSSLVDQNLVAGNTITIKEVNMYVNTWQLKATITSMGEVRTWNRNDRSGKVQSLDLADETGEIRMTLFTESIDKYEDILEEGKTYYFSGGKIQHRNKKFNQLNHPMEITANSSTQIKVASDQDVKATIHFKFVPLESLKELADKASCDVIGKVTNISDVETIVSKRNGQHLTKRSIHIADKSAPGGARKDAEITFWGTKAENLECKTNDVIAVKGARKSAFTGVSLTTYSDTRVFVDPEVPEAEELAMWDYSKEEENLEKPKSAGAPTDRGIKPLATIDLKDLGKEKTDYLESRIYVVSFSDKNMWYEACTQPNCNKKVTANADGSYYCPGCGNNSDSFNLRYTLKAQVGDYSSKQYITAFDDIATILMGKPASELKELGEQELKDHFQQRKYISYDMLLRAAMDNNTSSEYEPRRKLTASRAKPVENKTAIKDLLEQIKKSM